MTRISDKPAHKYSLIDAAYRVFYNRDMNLGFQELLVIFVIALLVFGPKRLPELGKSLGKGIRDFKKALSTDTEDEKHLPPSDQPPQKT